MNRRRFLASTSAAILATPLLSRTASAQESPFRTRYFPLAAGVGVHDVAPAADGSVWFTGQRIGALGRLTPHDGSAKLVDLGKGAAPHGVIIGPDSAPWVTEGGQNAIARVDPVDYRVTLFPLPETEAYANLNTAAFDRKGILWFTGQSGIYGRLDPKSGEITVFKAPRGPGTYGITATPSGDIWYASLVGSHIAKIDTANGNPIVIEPPTPHQGARRVWSDSMGRIWVSEWNSGHVSVHDPAEGSWKSWKLPGEHPRAYAVYVDDKDKVWVSDFSANAILRFDSTSEAFSAFPSDKSGANVRQLNGPAGTGLGRGIWLRPPRADRERMICKKWRAVVQSDPARATKRASAVRPVSALASMRFSPTRRNVSTFFGCRCAGIADAGERALAASRRADVALTVDGGACVVHVRSRQEPTMARKPLQLGRAVEWPARPQAAQIDRMPNPQMGTDYLVRFTVAEFTSICPVTGQPDFAHLVIDYAPGQWLLESKSLKLYVASFRNHGAFHEDCTVMIGRRIFAEIKPKWLRIGGYWYPRGGIPIDIFWQRGKLPKGLWVPDQGVATYRGRG